MYGRNPKFTLKSLLHYTVRSQKEISESKLYCKTSKCEMETRIRVEKHQIVSSRFLSFYISCDFISFICLLATTFNQLHQPL